MTNTKSTKQRGGSRPGSGRKPLNGKDKSHTRRTTITLTNEDYSYLGYIYTTSPPPYVLN